jgi:hypothetical protein
VAFGMTFDEAKATAARARSGDAAAALLLQSNAGFHVMGRKVDPKTLLIGAAVVGGAIATGGILAGATTLAGVSARKGDAPPRPTGDFMVPQTWSATGGSAGRSASPLVPSRSSGIVPGLVGIGLDWLRNRANGSGGGTSLVQQCPPGTLRLPGGACGNLPGGEVTGGGMILTTGEVVRGRYGAAEMPDARPITTKRCRKGLILGDDELCYRKADLRKDERKWVPGRKPLLTGGELNAIRTAARAANKMKSHQRNLQSLGLLPRPKSRRQIELELRYSGKLRGR